KPQFQGPTTSNGSFNWGDYHFSLESPNGTVAVIGRQRPGRQSYSSPALPGSPNLTERWTFTELFHVNETDVAGTWTLYILDERNNVASDSTADPAAANPPQARVRSVDLKIFGHQTYAQPALGATSSSGVASAEGTQRLTITGSGFARSQGKDPVTQAYWQPLDAAGAPSGAPVELSSQYSTTATQYVDIPASVLPAGMPGQGGLFIANPAVVIGRTGTAVGATDAFDTRNVLLPTTVSSPTAGTLNVDRYMKRCPGTDDKVIRYSRRPTLTPIPDISLPNGGTFSVSTVAFDPDVAAGLPNVAPAVPETLTVTVTSFNPYFIPSGNIVPTATPAAPGLGTYAWNITPINNNSGFALIEVKVTDGVLTATRAFRVIIPTDEDPNSCGGGMGLALLGIPLAAWFIRRRRRG
ncbi:MAG TPA: hypothetical protein DCS97_14145, partial [Planctomycetes bacterium]|nr:hypothetical protein [Planctomycetota bacterium]